MTDKAQAIRQDAAFRLLMNCTRLAWIRARRELSLDEHEQAAEAARTANDDAIMKRPPGPVARDAAEIARAIGLHGVEATFHDEKVTQLPDAPPPPEDANSPTPTRLLIKELVTLQARVDAIREQLGIDVMSRDCFADLAEP
jgi:hypothetical protein